MDSIDQATTPDRDRLLEAVAENVPFDGWSWTALDAAARQTGIPGPEARRMFPRGGVDMALGFHRMMDRRLAAELASADLSAMKIREKIAHAAFRRIELVSPHRDAVRRAASLFALPLHMADGTRAVWETADVIWTGIGDTSDDYNWYSKRMILSTVLSSTLLYWLGDQSPDATGTRAFLDRRIENVMQFEKTKAMARKNPLVRAATWLPGQVLSRIRAPRAPATPPQG